MKNKDLKNLKETFYIYWMSRVPELDEDEAIDHLNFDLRSLNLIPSLNNAKKSKETVNN